VLKRSSYRRFEIILVDGHDLEPSLLERLAEQIGCYPELTWQLVRDRQSFNFSRRINLAAAKASGDFILLLNDDTEVLSPDWLEAMLTYGLQTGVGAVGAKLLYPDGRLQHCGVSVNDWGPYHCYAEAPDQWTSTNNHPLAVRNFIAVTGACLMMQHQRFNDLGGMDEALPLNYNDIDLCMRAYYAGDRNVYTPFARLLHYETASRPKGVQPEELSYFREKWQSRLPEVEADPYFSAWSQALYAPKVMPPLDTSGT
jgi:GT2 family glycosyltransferase